MSSLIALAIVGVIIGLGIRFLAAGEPGHLEDR
jgi:hypothetical protein